MKLTIPLKRMPYASTRAVHETDCYETGIRSMKASMLTWANGTQKAGLKPDIKNAYKETLDYMKSRQLLRMGMNFDQKIVERRTLRHFDESSAFLPMRTRILEEHMQTQDTLFQKAMIVSKGNKETMTDIVVETLAANPAAFYGLHGLRALAAAELNEHLKEELQMVQRQNMCVFVSCWNWLYGHPSLPTMHDASI